MRKTKEIMALFLGLAVLVNAYGAIVVTPVGDGVNYDEANTGKFRSTSVNKAFDIDGDNAYGTEGLFFFGNGLPNGANNQPFSCHMQVGAEWATFSAGSNFVSVAEGLTYGYAVIDDPALSIAPIVADWGIRSAGGVSGQGTTGSWLQLLKFTVDTNTPSSFRVGMMAGNLGGVTWSPSGLRLSVEGGTSAQVTGLASMEKGSRMVFFDVELNGETNGAFTIESQRRAATQGASLAGLTFDLPTAAGAAVISAVGDGDDYDETGVAAASFRSRNVPKGFDIGRDNAYGTEGYFFYGNGVFQGNNPPVTSSPPSWVTLTPLTTGKYAGSGYDDFDNPTLPIGVDVADWTITGIGHQNLKKPGGRWGDLFSFTLKTNAPTYFRMGILAGNESSADGRWDPSGLRLSYEGFDTNVVEVTNLPVDLGWVFFDVEVPKGKIFTFKLEGQNRTLSVANNIRGPSLAGITFDVVTIPMGTVILVM